MPSVAASHVPCMASYAMTGSLARSDGPGRGDESETPGNRPAFHVAPASRDVEKPMATAPPSKTRPVWKTETMVEPNANVSGSTCVACWPIGSLVRSLEICRETTSQSRGTESLASAVTMSRPAPQRDGVARAVAVGGNAIVAGARVDDVASRAAEDDVGAREAGDRVLARAPVEDIGSWSPDEYVPSGRPRDGRRRCEACHERSRRRNGYGRAKHAAHGSENGQGTVTVTVPCR